MVENIIAVVSAVAGTVGFALMLRLKYSRLPIIALSTAFCFSIYLLATYFSLADFIANFLAALLGAFLSEFLAIRLKAPVMVFLIPTILPLVPGSHLYYMIEAFFQSNLRKTLYHFSVTGRTIGAILLGIITVNTVMKCIRNYKAHKKNG